MSLNIEDFRNVGINKLYHITYLENLDSILKNNILCKSKLNKLNINHTSHSDPEIILKRKDKHKDINNFISLFFNKNTPMLYDVKFKTDKVLILEFNIFDIHQNSKSNWDKSFFSNKNYLSLQKPILDSRQLYNYTIIH